MVAQDPRHFFPGCEFVIAFALFVIEYLSLHLPYYGPLKLNTRKKNDNFFYPGEGHVRSFVILHLPRRGPLTFFSFAPVWA